MEIKLNKLTFANAKKVKEETRQEKDKVFKVGEYTCKIVEARETDPKYVPKDPTWKSINIKLEGSGNKIAFATVEFPTERAEYIVDGKDRWYMFLRFKDFASAVGCKDDEDIGAWITKNLLDPAKLVGKHLRVKFDYNKGYYAKYIKDSTFHLINTKDGKPVGGDTPVEFPSRDACEAHCMQNGLKFTVFTSAVGYLPPDEEIVQLKEAKKEEKPVKKEKKIELPF